MTSLLMLLLASSVAASEAPTFEADTEVVLRTLSVRVSDRKGNPVRELSRDDFVVMEDGETRAIETFEEVRYPDPSSHALPGGTSAGFTAPPRHFLFVLDRTRRGPPLVFRRIRERLEEFTEQQLLPGDRVAVAQYAEQKQVVKGFTSDPAKVIANIRGGDVDDGKLRTFVLEAPQDDWDPIESPFLAAVAAATGQGVKVGLGEKLERFFSGRELESYFRFLEALGHGLSVVPDPKVVVLATSGFDVDPVVTERGELYARAIAALTALTSSGAELYVIDSGGLSAPGGGPTADRSGYRSRQDSLLWLADETGGLVYRSRNDYGSALAEVGRRESGYYSIGFLVELERDGARHKVEVRLKDQDKHTVVTAQAAFSAPRPLTGGDETRRRVDLIRMASLREPAAEVQAALAAESGRGADGAPQLMVGLDVAAGAGERDIHLQAEGWQGLFVTRDVRVGPEPQRLIFELPGSSGVIDLAAAVRDRKDGHAGAAYLSIEAPDLTLRPAASLHFGSPERAADALKPAAPDREGRLAVFVSFYDLEPELATAGVDVAWSVGDEPIAELARAWLAASGASGGSGRLAVSLDVSKVPPGPQRLEASLLGRSLTLSLPFERLP